MPCTLIKKEVENNFYHPEYLFPVAERLSELMQKNLTSEPSLDAYRSKNYLGGKEW